jgi:hypothetical protein
MAIEVAEFVAEVGRKSSHRNGLDPNDRHFDPEFSRRLRKMPPEVFDELMSDRDLDESLDDTEPGSPPWLHGDVDVRKR